MRRGQLVRRLALAAAVLLTSLAAAGIILSETALRLPPLQRHNAPEGVAARFSRQHHAQWRNAGIAGADGAPLCGWLFMPERWNGSAVLVLHGVADTRTGALGHAAMLLDHGYIVLTPDSRAHGESGGELFTFGVLERNDLRLWADWLRREVHAKRVFGLGESMGAAILIQATDSFQAVVAECSFSTFREVARYRVSQKTGLAGWLVAPPVEAGFLAARVRHGIDLDRASPLESIRRTATPVLLIHGDADTNIPPRHSEDLFAANPVAARLWLVPGAPHAGALAVQPEEFQRKVLAWFDP